MPLHIVRTDLTDMRVDAIVNPTNTHLHVGDSLDYQIFQRAGMTKLAEACAKIGRCEVGSAVITPGFDLPARYIIHTAGPLWQDGYHGEPELLAASYISCLRLALEHELESIAFPLISSGAYGYPKQRAVRLAVETVRRFLATHTEADLDVSLVLYDDEACTAGTALYGAIETIAPRPKHASSEPTPPDDWPYWAKSEDMPYGSERARRMNDALSNRYNNRMSAPPRNQPEQKNIMRSESASDDGDFDESDFSFSAENSCPPSFDDEPTITTGRLPIVELQSQPVVPKAAPLAKTFQNLNSLSEVFAKAKPETTFSQHLLMLIDRTGEKDSAIYFRANIDRKLFSKIRSNPHYQPSKETAIALSMALRLTHTEADELLRKAGYALTQSSPRDMAVMWCFDHAMYDVIELNLTLLDHDLPPLN